MEKRFRAKYYGAPSQGVLLFFFTLLSTLYVSAAEKPVIGPGDFVDAFVKKAKIVDASEMDIQAAEADLDRAYSMHIPKIKATASTGPHPKYEYHFDEVTVDGKTGNLGRWKRAEDLSDLDKWGIAVRLDGSFVMPLYTFGKISNAKGAARRGVEVAKAKRDITVLKLKKEALSIYYSYVMATEMEEKLSDAVEKVKEAETKLKEMLFEEKEGVTQTDLIKLRIEKENILYRYDQIRYSRETIKSVFSKLFGDDWEIKDRYLSKINFDRELEELSVFLQKDSPYSRLVTNGLEARRYLYELEFSNILPDLGFGGSIEYKYTSSVKNDTESPIPNSPYNGTDGEIGIGMTFNLNFWEQWSKIKKSKARWKSDMLRAAFARDTSLLELKKKYNELKFMESKIRHIRKARKHAKGWMTMELANYRGGFGKPSDLVDSIKKFSEQEFLLISSYYDYNMKVEEIKSFVGMN